MHKQKNHEKRLEKVREIISKKRIDAALLFSGDSLNDLSSKNTYYLSGFFDSWPHAVIVTEKYEAVLTGEPSRAEKESAIKNIIPSKKGALERFLKEKNIKKIGIDSNFPHLRWTSMRKKIHGLSFKDISREMLEIRAIKDKSELSKISHASKITWNTIKSIESIIKTGDESALVKKIMSCFINSGAESAFKPIVAGDKNSANIHYFECNSKYNKIVMADIGARCSFYNSDITRTFILENNREMIRAHELLEQLTDELIDFIKPGIKCIETFNYAKKFLEKQGHKKESFANFHSLGHGIGLDVHEYPVITKNPVFKDARFEENMVFTLEPALYFKDKFGIRIEDTIILAKNGVKQITN